MKRAVLPSLALAGVVVSLFPACGSTVEQAGSSTGGAGGVSGTGGVGGVSASSGTTSSSTTSSASTSSTSSSTSTTSSTSTSTVCPPVCATDADCATCPTNPGTPACCDQQVGVCYLSATSGCPNSPEPCAPGNACSTWGSCAGGPGSCTAWCSCDATSHYTCHMKTDAPACPAVHAACGAPCDSAYLQLTSCMCSPDGGQTTEPCGCDDATSTWTCWPPANPAYPCPPLGHVQRWTSCVDFPAGLVCDLGECACEAGCGTQVWTCGIGP